MGNACQRRARVGNGIGRSCNGNRAAGAGAFASRPALLVCAQEGRRWRTGAAPRKYPGLVGSPTSWRGTQCSRVQLSRFAHGRGARSAVPADGHREKEQALLAM